MAEGYIRGCLVQENEMTGINKRKAEITASFDRIFNHARLWLCVCTLFCFCAGGCARNTHGCSRLEIYVPSGINVTVEELRERFQRVRLDDGPGCTLRVTVYGYSAGAEVISLTEGKDFTANTGRAWIKGLVQVIDNDVILRADFVEVSGRDRAEMLNSFCAMVMEIEGL